jgi:hypothetical protein
MVFDLVRGLGAQKGELEVNVLAVAPLKGSDPREVEWAPEVEGALFDGFALELELPFEGSELEAVKLAAQGTFGTAFENRFIHGTQVIAERFRHGGEWELTFLYVPGIRFDRVWSALFMLGFRTTVGSEDDETHTDALLNFSLFADVGLHTSLGLETNYASELGGEDASLLLMPQVHHEITDHFMVQAGIGVRFVPDEALPEAGARVIHTF